MFKHLRNWMNEICGTESVDSNQDHNEADSNGTTRKINLITSPLTTNLHVHPKTSKRPLTSPTPTPSTTRAKLTSSAHKVHLTVMTKDAANNKNEPGVIITYRSLNGTRVNRTGTSNGDGVFKLSDVETGQAVAFEAKKTGFADLKNVVIELEPDKPRQQAVLSLSRRLKEGMTKRVVLNWGPKPLDLDLKVVKLDPVTGANKCITYWNNRRKCQGLALDIDNRKGGEKGAETITWYEEARNEYIIFVQDFSRELATPFERSHARIALYGPGQHEVVEMNAPKAKPPKRAKFWVVGCVGGEKGLSSFRRIDKLTNKDPRRKGKEMCDSLKDSFITN